MSRYIFTTLFVLGVLISPFSVLQITYKCQGEEMFPIFYGSPFVHKATSLGSSMAYVFYLTGMVSNLVIWGASLLLLHYLIEKFIWPTFNKTKQYLGYLFKAIAVIYFVFALLVLSSGDHMLETSVNLDKEAAEWGMRCEGHFGVFD